ncbi:unnamed protein product [Alternaria alternata]
MSVVSLLGVEVKNNPARFDEPYEFEITFECLEQLQKGKNEYDQELDSVLVGPLPVGVNKFQFKADPPNLSRIPNSEIIGVTVILLSCSYDEREFVRVGYYVNNEYTDEALALDPPTKPVIEKVQRQILAEKPRVTRFAIKWYQPEADLTADGDQYGIEEEEEEEEEGEGAAAEGEDAAMAGAEDTAGPANDEDAESEAGSEEIDIEDSEDDEEEEGEEGGDDDMEMDEGEAGAANGDKPAQQQPGGAPQQQSGADVMVH